MLLSIIVFVSRLLLFTVLAAMKQYRQKLFVCCYDYYDQAWRFMFYGRATSWQRKTTIILGILASPNVHDFRAVRPNHQGLSSVHLP